MKGTRLVEEIDYLSTCLISGLDKHTAAYSIRNAKEILLRQDFANYVIEFLHCKFGLITPKDVVLKWGDDPTGDPVYSTSTYRDFDYTAKILLGFESKFMESDAAKIHY